MTSTALGLVRRHGTAMLATSCALAALIVALTHVPYASADGAGPGAGGIDVTTAQERARARFAELDTNDDGQLVAAELTEARPPHPRRGPGGHHRGPRSPVAGAWRGGIEDDVFARLDRDGSGALERGEFGREQLHQAMRAALAAQRIGRLDGNGDGLVSEAEFIARIAAMDEDGDGLLERGEWHPQRKPH